MAKSTPAVESLPGMASHLTHEQAVEKYLEPVGKGDTSKRLYREGRPMRFKGRVFAAVRPTSVTPLPQIRSLYVVSHIESLASSFLGYGQQQDACINVLTSKRKLQRYLGEVAEHIQQDLDVEAPLHKVLGGYAVDAYGHNRHFAAAEASMRQYGHPDRGQPLNVRVLFDRPFEEILGLQAVENNVSTAPPAWDTAFSIASYARLMESKGHQVNNVQIGKLFGMKPKNVWKMRTFASLPRWVQDYAINDRLDYSGIYHIHSIMSLYTDEDIRTMLDGLADRKASSKQVEIAVRKRATIADLPGELRKLVDEGDIANDYAELLVDMLRAGFDTSLVHQRVLSYLGPDKPSIGEAKKKHYEEVDAFIEYDGQTMLGSMGEVNPDYVEDYVHSGKTSGKTTGLAHDMSDAQLRAQAKALTDDLDGMLSALNTGIAGKAMRGTPITEAIANNGVDEMLSKLGELIDAESGEDADSQKAKVKEIRRKLGENTINRTKELNLFA